MGEEGNSAHITLMVNHRLIKVEELRRNQLSLLTWNARIVRRAYAFHNFRSTSQRKYMLRFSRSRGSYRWSLLLTK